MKKKIEVACIIDDDEIYIFGIKRLVAIGKLCDNLLIFKNGEEAFDYLSSIVQTPHLLPEIILLDINMPIMDGWEFVERFATINNQLERKIIIYMISSSVNPKDLDKAKAISDISNYYIKPMTMDMLSQIFSSEEVETNSNDQQ